MKHSTGPKTVDGLARLGRMLMAAGQGGKAARLVADQLAQRPDDVEAESLARAILSHGIPHWHALMLEDEPRNEAFARAIERAVGPATRVLDIGTGSGLLAMIAARAGAADVVGCEAHPALAETAGRIVATNGLEDRVRIIAKHSTELDPDRDLRGRPDLVVAEIFDDELIGEGALASLRHAVSRLAADGATVIPASGSMRVALAWRELPARRFGDVRGFDLSLFERHVSASRKLPPNDRKLSLRSDPADLFRFDFSSLEPPEYRSTLRLRASGGPANGVVRWIRLKMDDTEYYENAPAVGGGSHWAVLFDALPCGTTLAAGESVLLHAAHDGERVRIWFEGR